jgi:subtilase family serine protease
VCTPANYTVSTQVDLPISADATIRANVPPNPPDDSFVGMAPTGHLYPGQSSTVPINANAYVPPPGGDGAFYLGAVADPFNSRMEFLEDNNAKAGYRMGVGNRPDFAVTAVTGPTSVQSGQSFTAQVTVCNHGTQPDSTELELYLSADATIRANVPPNPPEDSFVGMAPTGYLYPGQCSTVPINANAYVPPPGGDGAYYLGAVADPYNSRMEFLEDNNAKAGYRMGVGNKPDFTITAVTGPYSVKPGNTFTVNTTVCNRGQMADTTDVELYLSADTTVRGPTPPLPPEDFYLGALPGLSLAPGACLTRSLLVMAPSVPDGAYYLGAVADPYNSRMELLEDNNAKAGNIIGVGNRSDFTITSLTGPTTIAKGASFSASVTLCNRGQVTDTTDVEFYFSANTTISAPVPPSPPEDFYLGTLPGVTLTPGACTTRTVTLTANVASSASYYLGAVADPYNSSVEFREDNNTRAGTYTSVTP